ncbi:MAG: TetR/AcrR family transcriptional regulator [Tannerellaceae bacterium]|jgi:AcrR family transcriptional regulator|nr:TetR/AcrR family transcriptional regulator [Tannerellaceae bacterium]
MPRTKEQYEALRAEKKQLIMDAALEVFAEAGYALTSIDQIAKRAGIAKGLIYTYFESKEDLLHQILVFGVKKMSEGLFPEQMTPEIFVNSVEKMFDNVLIYRDFFKLYTALSVQPEVTNKLGPLADEHRGLHSMIELYKRHFGDKATKELLLMTTLSKGYSILALFGDRQKTIPLDLLKETVMDIVKQKFGISE